VTAPVALAAALLTVLAMHAGLRPHLAVWGLAPDVLLVAVVAVAAGHGERAGATFGFAAGLGADLFLATPLGTSALAYTVVGHVVGRATSAPLSTVAAALCSPASPCFACRTGRRHPRRRRDRRRAAAWRTALRRSIVVVFVGVAAGRLGTAAVATAFGGIPAPDVSELLRMAGIAGLSALLGPPAFALHRRLGHTAGVQR
jgi:hypothetical protein